MSALCLSWGRAGGGRSHAEIVFNGGTLTLTVKMAFHDFPALVKPVMAQFSVFL